MNKPLKKKLLLDNLGNCDSNRIFEGTTKLLVYFRCHEEIIYTHIFFLFFKALFFGNSAKIFTSEITLCLGLIQNKLRWGKWMGPIYVCEIVSAMDHWQSRKLGEGWGGVIVLLSPL